MVKNVMVSNEPRATKVVPSKPTELTHDPRSKRLPGRPESQSPRKTKPKTLKETLAPVSVIRVRPDGMRTLVVNPMNVPPETRMEKAMRQVEPDVVSEKMETRGQHGNSPYPI